jgi:hypothetical protein
MLEDRTCPADRCQVLNMTGVHRRRCQGEVRAVTLVKYLVEPPYVRYTSSEVFLQAYERWCMNIV